MADDRSLDLQGVKADGESTGEGEKVGRQNITFGGLGIDKSCSIIC